MNGSNQTKMTVLYITNTGHIVGGVTRTDSSAPSPKVADLVGSGLTLRSAPNFQAGAALPVATFIIPPSDLLTVDVGFDQVGTYPWGQAIVQNAATSTAGASVTVNNCQAPATQPIVTSVSSAGRTQLTVSLTTPTASSYYIVTAQAAATTTALVPASGPTNASPASQPVNLSLPTPPPGTYAVLVLVSNMLPYLGTFTV